MRNKSETLYIKCVTQTHTAYIVKSEIVQWEENEREKKKEK